MLEDEGVHDQVEVSDSVLALGHRLGREVDGDTTTLDVVAEQPRALRGL